MWKIPTLRAQWRGLKTESRTTLPGTTGETLDADRGSPADYRARSPMPKKAVHMGRTSAVLFLTVCLVSCGSTFEAASAKEENAADTFASVENRCRRVEESTASTVCQRLNDLIPGAAKRAFELCGYGVDPAKLVIKLVEMPTKPVEKRVFMRVSGGDRALLEIMIEPILRGDLSNDSAISVSLEHEFIHLGIRQQMSPETYAELPEWFQEGLPVFHVEQGIAKLQGGLIGKCADVQRLIEASFDGADNDPYVAGYFTFAALMDERGIEGLHAWVDAVVASGSVDDGCRQSGVDLRRTRNRAAELLEAAVSDLIGDSIADKCRCSELSSREAAGAAEARECWTRFQKDHREPLNQVLARYGLAKARYHLGDFAKAAEMFGGCLDAEVPNGMRDDARFYQLKSRYLGKDYDEAKSLCDQFLKLYPESGHRADALEAYWRLTALHDR